MSTGSDRAERVHRILIDHLRAMLSGEGPDEAAIVATHPDLAREVETALHKIRLFSKVCAELDRRGTSPEFPISRDPLLAIRCPHCHTVQRVAVDAALDALGCTSCGDRFSLLGEEMNGHAAQGRLIARFELLEKLGSGGFGTVWMARDTELARLVAVKLPRCEQLTAVESELFLREARAAAQLHHPGIVAIHEVGREDGSIYIVSTLVEGVSLADWLIDQRMSVREAAELCSKLASALAHAHERGVIHRDLKPANVILDRDLCPHVTDFGLARRDTGEVTMTVDGQLVGTPAYMSPEQARGDSHTSDARSDVYALGVMLYELLTGERPFRGATATVLHQVIHEEPSSPRKLNSLLPRDLETITLKCLQKNPERRYSNAQHLHEDLDRFLRQEPIHARPVTSVERLWLWSHRKPALAASLALVGILLTIVVVGSPIAIYHINRARVQAEKARVEEVAQRKRTETRETLMRAQLLCDEHFEEAAQLVLGIPSQALQAERVNAAMTFKTLTDAYARHGRWKEALPHAIKAVEYKPDDHMNYVSLLVLLAGTGALKDYNTHRHACLDLFGEPQNPFFGERIAKACLIFPALGSDLEVADKLAQAALIAASAEEKRDRNRDARQLVEAPGITDFAVVYVSYHQFAKGLADYRQGRFASAAQLMQKSISDPFYGQGHSRYLQSYMVLAMAYYQMNEYDQARAAFDKGVEIEMTKLPALDSAYVGPDWYWRDLVVARALKNEAQSLLEGAASQAR